MKRPEVSCQASLVSCQNVARYALSRQRDLKTRLAQEMFCPRANAGYAGCIRTVVAIEVCGRRVPSVFAMRSIVFEKFGEPADVLSLRDVPIPEPAAGEVRVHMLAAPVNPSDLLMIRGQYARLPNLPATPGFEGVGVVEAAGPGVAGRFLLGKRVAALNSRTGSWAEFAIVPARQAIPLSRQLPLEQAAMFFVNPATAYILTQKVLAVPSGEWLLQTASGSALGRMIIRLGKRFGFRTINVVRRAEQVAELNETGADVVIADAGTSLRDQVRAATGGRGVRYAIDAVGGTTGAAVVACLAPGGRLILYGTLSGDPLPLAPRDLIASSASIEGFWLGHWMARQNLISKLKLVRTLTRLILDGVLASEVGQMFSLTQIAEAVGTAERAARGGKVLLKIGD
jgi:NADPH:quinone reductase-like Zn-dependent oxidoreductase